MTSLFPDLVPDKHRVPTPPWYHPGEELDSYRGIIEVKAPQTNTSEVHEDKVANPEILFNPETGEIILGPNIVLGDES